MRELRTADIFKMSKILDKMDIELAADEGKSEMQLGVDLIMKIGENLHIVEKEVNSLMAGLLGITPKDFSELPFTKVLEYMEEFKQLEGIDNFLKLAGKQNKK